MLENDNQYISDKYGRIGHLTNKGEYYMFKPNEITDEKPSLYESEICKTIFYVLHSYFLLLLYILRFLFVLLLLAEYKVGMSFQTLRGY